MRIWTKNCAYSAQNQDEHMAIRKKGYSTKQMDSWSIFKVTSHISLMCIIFIYFSIISMEFLSRTFILLESTNWLDAEFQNVFFFGKVNPRITQESTRKKCALVSYLEHSFAEVSLFRAFWIHISRYIANYMPNQLLSLQLKMVCNWMVCEFMIPNKFMKLMMDSMRCLCVCVNSISSSSLHYFSGLVFVCAESKPRISENCTHSCYENINIRVIY